MNFRDSLRAMSQSFIEVLDRSDATQEEKISRAKGHALYSFSVMLSATGLDSAEQEAAYEGYEEGLTLMADIINLDLSNVEGRDDEALGAFAAMLRTTLEGACLSILNNLAAIVEALDFRNTADDKEATFAALQEEIDNVDFLAQTIEGTRRVVGSF